MNNPWLKRSIAAGLSPPFRRLLNHRSPQQHVANTRDFSLTFCFSQQSKILIPLLFLTLTRRHILDVFQPDLARVRMYREVNSPHTFVTVTQKPLHARFLARLLGVAQLKRAVRRSGGGGGGGAALCV